MERLTKRHEFVRVARGRRQAKPGLVLQARRRDGKGEPRIGFTVTRKVGNAVVRNRVRRRLREAARSVMVKQARSGFDYVLIGRAATTVRPFSSLLDDLEKALRKIHDTRRPQKQQVRGRKQD